MNRPAPQMLDKCPGRGGGGGMNTLGIDGAKTCTQDDIENRRRFIFYSDVKPRYQSEQYWHIMINIYEVLAYSSRKVPLTT